MHLGLRVRFRVKEINKERKMTMERKKSKGIGGEDKERRSLGLRVRFRVKYKFKERKK